MFLIFKESFLNLKKTKSIALSALFIAIDCVLRLLVIPIGPTINITLFFLPLSVCSMLLGPTAAALTGAAADVLTYFISPTGPYFPGFTLNALICGLVYGIFLYKQKPTLPRIIIARVILMFVVDLVLTTLWLHFMYTAPILETLSLRVVKCLILLPVEVILLSVVLKSVYKFKDKWR